jgi:Ca2+-binding EF-hand superfamily protein
MPALTADDVATITEFLNYVDADKSGLITVQEIQDACQVDTNSDGVISQAEIIESARPWMEAFTAQDLNQDQQISLNELLSYNAAAQ